MQMSAKNWQRVNAVSDGPFRRGRRGRAARLACLASQCGLSCALRAFLFTVGGTSSEVMRTACRRFRGVYDVYAGISRPSRAFGGSRKRLRNAPVSEAAVCRSAEGRRGPRADRRSELYGWQQCRKDGAPFNCCTHSVFLRGTSHSYFRCSVFLSRGGAFFAAVFTVAHTYLSY